MSVVDVLSVSHPLIWSSGFYKIYSTSLAMLGMDKELFLTQLCVIILTNSCFLSRYSNILNQAIEPG